MGPRMKNDRRKSGLSRDSANPHRPAYDNPVGNKGDLVAGNNVVKRPPRVTPGGPQGHDSDKKLGQKPPR
jgi:hypothetical protein